MPSSTTVIVSRPIGEIFQFLSELEHLATWDGRVRWARQLVDGPLGVGATFEQAIRLDGRIELALSEIVAYEPPYQFAWVNDLDTARVTTRITLESMSTGTRLTLRRHEVGVCAVGGADGTCPEADLRRLRDVLEG